MQVLIKKQEPDNHLCKVADDIGFTEESFGYTLHGTSSKKPVHYPIFIQDFKQNKNDYFWKTIKK